MPASKFPDGTRVRWAGDPHPNSREWVGVVEHQGTEPEKRVWVRWDKKCTAPYVHGSVPCLLENLRRESARAVRLQPVAENQEEDYVDNVRRRP